jgi:PKD repeat protein
MKASLITLLALVTWASVGAARAQAPSNNAFVNAAPIIGSDATILATNTGATPELGELDHAGYHGNASVWWVWRAPASGTVAVDLAGSFRGAVLAVYAGKYLTDLGLVSSNAFANADGTGKVGFQSVAGTTYQIAVDNTGNGAQGEIRLSLKLKVIPPPSIARQPVDLTVFERRDTALFEAVASSTVPATYQWRFGGADIVGATNATLTLPNVVSSDAGSYSVVVGNPGGSVESRSATLTVRSRPPNDDFTDRIAMRGANVSVSGSTHGATVEPGELAGRGSVNSIWWTWTAVGSGLVSVDAAASGPDTQMDLFTGDSLGRLTPVVSSYETGRQGNGQARWVARAGTVYQLRVAPGSALAAGGEVGLRLQFLGAEPPPQIVQQPRDQHVRERETAAFEVRATSDSVLSYQWRFNGADMPGATGPTLTLASVRGNQEGLYSVVVRNGGGSVESRQATLTVDVRPLNDDFVNRVSILGTNVSVTGTTLNATTETGEATGRGGFRSVWWAWTAPTSGRLSAELAGSAAGAQLDAYTGARVEALNPVPLEYQIGGDGTGKGQWTTVAGTSYQLRVSLKDGSIPGGDVSLRLSLQGADVAPKITLQPQDQEVVDRQGTAAFAVAATGTGVLGYQWRWNGANLVGETGALLTLSPARTNHAGIYSVVVANAAGSVESRQARLTVRSRPPNDDFADRIGIVGTNSVATGSTQNATTEFGELTGRGYLHSAWWSWTAPGPGTAIVDLSGSNPGTQVDVYTGDRVEALAKVTVLYETGNDGCGRARWVVTPGTTYRIKVGIGDALTVPGDVRLSVSLGKDAPPSIPKQPPDQEVFAHEGAVVLTTDVTSLTPVTFQWLFNGGIISGATGPSLTLGSVGGGQGGYYSVLITNEGGTVESRPILVKVRPRPPNDDFVNRITLVGTNLVTRGTTLDATLEAGEPNGQGYRNSVWWSWTARESGLAVLDLAGSAAHTQVDIYTGDAVGALTSVPVPYEGGGVMPGRARWIARAGAEYRIKVALDDPKITGAAVRLALQFLGPESPPEISQQPQDQKVLARGTAVFQVTASSLSPLAYQWRHDGRAMVGASNDTLVLRDVSLDQAGLYSVVVGNGGGNLESRQAALTVDARPPNDDFVRRIEIRGTNATVTGTTLSATIEDGEPVERGAYRSVWWTWTAPATGPAVADLAGSAVPSRLGVYTADRLDALAAMPATYADGAGGNARAQWNAIRGTAYVLRVAIAEPAGTGGDVQLRASLLGVDVAPRITLQPQDQEVIDRQGTAVFSVVATSIGTPSYQWRKDGLDLVGQTDSLLVLSQTRTNQAGAYSVLVSNGAGSVESRQARLTVRSRPPNDDFAFRIQLEGTNLTATGSTVNATTEFGEATGRGYLHSVWWSWVAPTDGTVVADLTGSRAGSQLDVATGDTFGSLQRVEVAYELGSGGSGRAQWEAVAGRTYHFKVALSDILNPGGDVSLAIRVFPLGFLPKLEVQPAELELVERRDDAVFTVKASSTTPVTYQWAMNGRSIPGATSSILALQKVRLDQAGTYSVSVENRAGVVVSRSARLTVHARPLNDDFADRIGLTNAIAVATGSNRYATIESDSGEQRESGQAGATVWWNWTARRSADALLDWNGSEIQPLATIYTGSELGSLRSVASSSGTGGTLRFPATSNATYQIRIDGLGPAKEGSIRFRVGSLAPPVILREPQDWVGLPGEEGKFSVGVESLTPVRYQWQFSGTDIPSETNAVLRLASVGTNHVGKYSAIVRNDYGEIRSRIATLALVDGVRGMVTDATDRHPLPGVTVWVGSVTNVTDEHGNYRLLGLSPGGINPDFDADRRSGQAPLTVHFLNQTTAGERILNAATNGYLPYRNSRVAIRTGQPVELEFSMTPVLPPNTMRLVLNWGDTPRDLDANLLTPTVAGQAWHLYYPPGFRGSLAEAPFAVLDTDYTNGFGPETITIGRTVPGEYRYYVHRFAGTGEISGTPASVKIYTSEGLVRTIDAPATGAGEYWDVCSIDGLTRAVTILNRFRDDPPASPAFGAVSLATAVTSSPAMSLPSRPTASDRLLAFRGLAGPGSSAPGGLGSRSYVWDFGDGTTSREVNPTKTYNKPGMYSVSLAVDDGSGTLVREAKTDFIEVIGPRDPPTVAVLSPPHRSVFREGSRVPVEVSATDGSGTVTNVVLILGGTNVVGGIAGPPYRQVWEGVHAGVYSLTARASSDSGLSSTSAPVDFVVDAPPVVRISSPMEGAVFTSEEPVSLIAEASDRDGAVTNVLLVLNGSAPLGNLAKAPYQMFANRLVAGDYSLFAVATDDRGLSTTSSVVRWQVNSIVINHAPTLDGISDRTIREDAPTQTVDLSGIGSGAVGETQKLVVSARSSDPALMPDPVVDFASPGGSGTLKFKPMPDRSGTATITVTVQDDGGTANGGQDKLSRTFRVTVLPVNDAPSFVKGSDVVVNENSGAQSVLGWGTAISPGPADEASQKVTFVVVAQNASLFADPPRIDGTGRLTFTPAPKTAGSTSVSVTGKDDGGTANGGSDTSASASFVITIRAVNHAPTLDGISDRTIREDAPTQSVALSGIGSGAVGEKQKLVVSARSSDPTLIPSPVVDYASPGGTGTLKFQPMPDRSGTATITVTVQDDGGTANGGQDKFSRTFGVTVLPVNDAPSFVNGSDVVVEENSGAQSVPGWGTAISPGPADEASQKVTFVVVAQNASLFADPPRIDGTGRLTFTPEPNTAGSSSVSVTGKDDGGTANGGSDTSASASFVITIRAVNQAPTLDGISDRTIREDAPSQTLALSGIGSGAVGETQKLVVSARSSDPALIPDPVVDFASPGGTGTLRFQPMPDRSGTATITVTVQDDGGTANGGQDRSSRSFLVTVLAVNDPPSFAKGSDVVVDENSGAQSVPGWATTISPGPADEASQKVAFVVVAQNASLFADPPRIDGTGRLTFLPAPNTAGGTTVSVTGKDDGGTGNGGSDTSAARSFTITVNARREKSPSVRIIAPSDYDSFRPDAFRSPPTADIDVHAEVVVGSAEIAKVEFFSGSVLLGTATRSPHRLRWADVGVGDYRLTARVTDLAGRVGESSPVRVSVSDLAADVAIIRNYDDPEIDQLRNYLLEMGLGSRVFDQDGLTFETLRAYRLVIWAGLSRIGEGVTDNDVDILKRSFSVGIPLFFIGDRLASDVSHLVESARLKWQSLIHVRILSPRSSSGRVDIAPFDGVDDESSNQPGIVNGRFGTLNDFVADQPFDVAELAPDDEGQVIGRTVDGASLVAFPNLDLAEPGRVRSFTALGRIWQGIDDESSRVEKMLFQNVVCWLLECRRCGAVKLHIEAEPESPIVQVGETAKFLVKVSQSGECEATGVAVAGAVPDGVTLVRLLGERGAGRVQGGQIQMALGHLASAEEVTVEIEMVPSKPGPIELCVSVSGNNETPDAGNRTCATVEVQGEEIPRLDVELRGTNLLLGWASTSRSWILESSDSMGGGARWKAVDGDAMVQNGRVTRTVSTQPGTRYFRLRR